MRYVHAAENAYFLPTQELTSVFHLPFSYTEKKLCHSMVSSCEGIDMYAIFM